ncbi:MAG: D-aminoacyl-tRNA deacylase [Desulfurococcaceae archaeon]
MIGFVYSVIDPAGSGIAKYLVDSLKPDKSTACGNRAITCLEGDSFIIAGFKEDVIYFDFIDDELPYTVSHYIILSRHSSEAGIKSYTVHHTGNFSEEALYGGKGRELGIAYPSVSWMILRNIFEKRNEINKINFEVSYEATHHGPTSLSKPLVFVEIGSRIEEWSDIDNHAVIGEALIMYLENKPGKRCTPVIGIGGGHYPRKHTEIALVRDICYGHIMPKYALQYLDKPLLNMMTKRSFEKPVEIIAERKGIKLENRKLLEEFSDETGLELKYI